MTASRSDMHILSTDTTFGTRVDASLRAACVSIGNEGFSVPFHRERAIFASKILQSQSSTLYATWFTQSVATDTSVIADATQGGTVTLIPGNVVTQAALVTDAHIDAAVSAEFNTFIIEPGA